jgi:hypothetical protein
MSFTSGNFANSTLTDILRTVIETKQTGYLKVHDDTHDGCVSIENGVILHAKTGAARGLPALFDFVGWREPKFEFHERPMPADVTRDLAAYDSQVLLTGLSYKVAEHNLVHDATPGLDDILKYGGPDSHAQLDATPSDLKLLALADGRRSVRTIAEETGLSPSEAARLLARYRLAGALRPVTPRSTRSSKAMAA